MGYQFPDQGSNLCLLQWKLSLNLRAAREVPPTHSSLPLATLATVASSGPGSTHKEDVWRKVEKLTTIQPTSWNGGLLRLLFFLSFFEKRRRKNFPPSSAHYFSPAALFAGGVGGVGGQMSSFISLRLCLFQPGTSPPAEVQVYNGKLVPLLVFLVGNCYEITVISPFS